MENMEIEIKILPTLDISCLSSVAEYLSFSDIKAARLVCKEWHVELSASKFFKSGVANISGDLNYWWQTNQTVAEQFESLSNNCSIGHLVRSVCCRNMFIPDNFPVEFWQEYGELICSLRFQDVIFDGYSYLNEVLSACKNLTALSFHTCIGIPIDGTGAQLDFSLPKLRRLVFARCNFSTFLYHYLQDNVGPLQHLTIENCFVRTVQTPVQELPLNVVVNDRFSYPGKSIDLLPEFVASHHVSLTSLALHYCFNLTVDELKAMLEMKGLCLTEFSFKVVNIDISLAAIKTLKRCQRQIESISIDRLALEADSLSNCKECFPKLNTLDVVLGSDIPLIDLGSIQVPNLTVLGFAVPKDVEIYSEAVNLISDNFRTQGATLKLRHLNFDDAGLFSPSGLPLHLTTLVAFDCTFVNDEFVHNISRWITGLRHLDLSNSTNVTDYGFLGSDCSGEHLPLSNLKCLRSLNLRDCSEISDVTLLYAISFKELNSLDLSNCKYISDFGVGAVSKGNPSLETFKVKGCVHLSDTGLIGFLQNAPRLCVLDVLDCEQLTIASVNAAASLCPAMRMIAINSLADRNKAFEILKETLPRCAIADKDPFPEDGHEERFFNLQLEQAEFDFDDFDDGDVDVDDFEFDNDDDHVDDFLVEFEADEYEPDDYVGDYDGVDFDDDYGEFDEGDY